MARFIGLFKARRLATPKRFRYRPLYYSIENDELNERARLKITRGGGRMSLESAHRKLSNEHQAQRSSNRTVRLREAKRQLRLSDRIGSKYDTRMRYARVQRQRATANLRLYIILFAIILMALWIVFEFST